MKILIVVAPEGYQDIEYNTLKEILQKAGYEIVTTSTAEIAKGSLGGKTKVDLLLDKVNVEDYIAIVFIGGPGSHVYFNHKPVLKLAQDFYNAGKITAAICAAPSILANAGILNGKTATSFEGQIQNLKDKGAAITNNPIEQDGIIITANGPSAAKAFGDKIVDTLKNFNK
jgi:protease I